MTVEEFVLAIESFVQLDVVKAHRQVDDTSFVLELWADLERRDRSQVVQVQLMEGNEAVFAYSIIGEFPDDPQMLKSILRRAGQSFYSRVSFDNGNLVQLFLHQLVRTDEARLAEAIYEVASTADAIEEEFFGVDSN